MNILIFKAVFAAYVFLLVLLVYSKGVMHERVFGDSSEGGGKKFWLWVVSLIPLVVFMLPATFWPDASGSQDVIGMGLAGFVCFVVAWAIEVVRKPSLKHPLQHLWLTYVIITLPFCLSGHWPSLYVVLIGLGILAVLSVVVRSEKTQQT